MSQILNRPVLAILCLAPCLAMWCGLYQLKNTNITLAIYHYGCLLPGICLGYPLWRADVRCPTSRQWIILAATSVAFNLVTIFLYDHIGHYFLSGQSVMNLLKSLGFIKDHLLALSLYFIFINSTLEELFWRGVILNRLDQLPKPFPHFGVITSSVMYGAFHYLILRLVVYPGWAEVGFVMLALYGALLAILYKKTGSIVLPSLAHACLTDLAAMLLTIDLLGHYP